MAFVAGLDGCDAGGAEVDIVVGGELEDLGAGGTAGGWFPQAATFGVAAVELFEARAGGVGLVDIGRWFGLGGGGAGEQGGGEQQGEREFRAHGGGSGGEGLGEADGPPI